MVKPAHIYRLMQMPLQNITFVITPVMQPVFSSLQHDLSGLARKYIKVLQLLTYISFPLSALLYFTAEELILLFFGSQWHEAIGGHDVITVDDDLYYHPGTIGNLVRIHRQHPDCICANTIRVVGFDAEGKKDAL